MCKIIGSLTVYFDDPFWAGVFEIYQNGKLTAAKVTFGAEPKDSEVYEFVLQNYYRLKFSPPVETFLKEKKTNPKRLQREARKVPTEYVGTKSQQALKLQREQIKTDRAADVRQRKEERKRRNFELKQQKRKEKHKGK
ncbi:MAG: YjdF family protein [Ruminococcus sp.]|nr:YjdF family protein [Ruminococcus sp.]MCM1381747.1 YjdF family protein [Muribaculaceae bacterium]MCM1478947.1 YjdF family protein [Muribaculaceae bacterium]